MPRYIIAFVISLAITLGLFFLMQSLIKMGGSALTEPPKGSVLDFVRVKQDEQVEKKDRKPKKPPKPEQPPPVIYRRNMRLSLLSDAFRAATFFAAPSVNTIDDTRAPSLIPFQKVYTEGLRKPRWHQLTSGKLRVIIRL